MNQKLSLLVCILFGCLLVQEAPAANRALVFSNGKILATYIWERGPIEGGESILRVGFFDASTNAPVNPPGVFRLTYSMPSMCHVGSPVTMSGIPGASGAPMPGVYRITRIKFSMAGEWELKLTIQGTNGAMESRNFIVNL